MDELGRPNPNPFGWYGFVVLALVVVSANAIVSAIANPNPRNPWYAPLGFSLLTLMNIIVWLLRHYLPWRQRRLKERRPRRVSPRRPSAAGS